MLGARSKTPQKIRGLILNKIVSNSVLPAIRENLELSTDDGQTLVGEIAWPENKNPAATLVLVHPLPTHGGSSDSHVYRKISWRLPALSNFAILRFNTRGTTSSLGTSSGDFDSSNKEGLDLKAAVLKAKELTGQEPWLVGWSFGTDVILRNARDLNVSGVILLSPPLRFTKEDELARWRDFAKPIWALVPEFDDFLTPDQAKLRFSSVPNLRIVNAIGAKHLWIGESQVRFVLNHIVKIITGNENPLPEEFSGPMTRHNDLNRD